VVVVAGSDARLMADAVNMARPSVATTTVLAMVDFS